VRQRRRYPQFTIMAADYYRYSLFHNHIQTYRSSEVVPYVSCQGETVRV
jgi:hypothetical protein